MKKTVKAWAIMHRTERLILNSESQFSIWKNKNLGWLAKDKEHRVIPCTITYTLPKKARKTR